MAAAPSGPATRPPNLPQQPPRNDAVRVLLIILLVVAIGAIIWLVLRQWWIDQHCATILGTRVCR